jgi:hypothetical protein
MKGCECCLEDDEISDLMKTSSFLKIHSVNQNYEHLNTVNVVCNRLFYELTELTQYIDPHERMWIVWRMMKYLTLSRHQVSLYVLMKNVFDLDQDPFSHTHSNQNDEHLNTVRLIRIIVFGLWVRRWFFVIRWSGDEKHLRNFDLVRLVGADASSAKSPSKSQFVSSVNFVDLFI